MLWAMDYCPICWKGVYVCTCEGADMKIEPRPDPICFVCQRPSPYVLSAPEIEVDVQALLPFTREENAEAHICSICLFRQLTGYPWREKAHPAWPSGFPKIQPGSDDKKEV
jgi:hypothetical protein